MSSCGSGDAMRWFRAGGRRVRRRSGQSCVGQSAEPHGSLWSMTSGPRPQISGECEDRENV
eukprot:710327-Rhodomonas_salina.2